MNQQCKVCGEPAAGFHFGAFTCEGCKSFFGRTYNNLGSISDCKNGGVCVINKKNRTACKACRLRKCLLVGMSKSGSRYGRRSNWFKIHCLLQEQNGNSGGMPPGSSPFAGGFLPSFLPTSQSQPVRGISYAKDGKERASPSQEDLALQSHLLHVAMIKQERNKSPHPDDVALQNQLRLLAWQKERERISQQQTSASPPREVHSPPTPFSYKPQLQMAFPVNFAGQKDTPLPSSPPEMFRPFLPGYKRRADTPSDSGTSSVDGAEHAECRSNSELSYFKASASPDLSEKEFPPRKINATVTLTTGYHPHPLGLVYSPPGLVTPAATQHSPRGGDLLLVSPSPGGLAVEQDEPIDLSVRSSKGSQEPSGVNRSKPEMTRNNVEDEIKEETTTKSSPLDLTLGVKRPAELPLTL